MSDSIRNVSQSFRQNIYRVESLLNLPASITKAYLEWNLHVDEAKKKWNIDDRFPNGMEWAAYYEASENISQSKLLESFEDRSSKIDSDSLVVANLKAMLQVMPYQDIKNGIDSIYTSATIMLWSAFESLAIDLWEAVLNYKPDPFVINFAGKKRNESDNNAKQLQVSDLAEVGFDVKNMMGTLLKTSLNDIKSIEKAYDRAFKHEFIAIVGPANYHGLHWLRITRNLLVHHRGIFQAEAISELKAIEFNNAKFDHKFTPPFRLPKLGDPVILNYNIVIHCMNTINKSCSNIIAFALKEIDSVKNDSFIDVCKY